MKTWLTQWKHSYYSWNTRWGTGTKMQPQIWNHFQVSTDLNTILKWSGAEGYAEVQKSMLKWTDSETFRLIAQSCQGTSSTIWSHVAWRLARCGQTTAPDGRRPPSDPEVRTGAGQVDVPRSWQAAQRCNSVVLRAQRREAGRRKPPGRASTGHRVHGSPWPG